MRISAITENPAAKMKWGPYRVLDGPALAEDDTPDVGDEPRDLAADHHASRTRRHVQTTWMR